MPFADSGYEVFRDVTQFGAKGDGIHDDTDAINNAIKAGARCGLGCTGRSTHGAIVYFPGGRTYLIKKPLLMYYFTQLIGDPNDRPTLKGSRDFWGGGIIDSNQWIPGDPGPNNQGRQW
jgi:glucan 1,3-beta-glucosidase